jgi:hypothetical protein
MVMSDDAKADAEFVERLETIQKELSAKIAQLNEAKKKDIWDKLGSLGGILVAVIGAVFSYIYQNHQSEQDAILKAQQAHLQQIQTVAPFMSYLTGPDDKARSVALFEVKDLLSPEVAVALAVNLNSAGAASGRTGPDKGVVNFLRQVQNTGNTPGARQLASQALKQVCGIERWQIKTAADPGAEGVLTKANAPVKATVEELAALPRPSSGLQGEQAENARSTPIEQTVYVVTATMTSMKHEVDGDYHLVLQGSRGATIVAEIPSPDCYSGDNTEVPNDFQTARGVVDSVTNLPSGQNPPLSRLRTSVPVTVTGVGFFDLPHGQMGMAPNGLELHPVLKIVAASP